MKYPYDEGEDVNEELYVAKSFSLKRKLIAAIRVRARALGISMSAYVATLIRNDLVRGTQAPLWIDACKSTELSPSPPSSSPRGVVVPEFDLADD
jgi:hypothetical protein